MHKKRTVLPLVLIYAISIGAGMDDVGIGDYIMMDIITGRRPGATRGSC
jgi:hypothetical protein